jgi:excisionase family DNA binding protein
MSEPHANAKSTLLSSTASIDAAIDELIDSIPSKLRMPSRTVSVEEAGDILGIGRMAAYHAVWRGQIPSIRIGRRLLVPVAGLKALLGETQPHEANGKIDDQPASAA